MIVASPENFISRRYTVGIAEDDRCVGLYLRISKEGWESLLQGMRNLSERCCSDTEFFIPEEGVRLYDDSDVFGFDRSVEVIFFPDSIVELRFLFMYGVGRQERQRLCSALRTFERVSSYLNYCFEVKDDSMDSDAAQAFQQPMFAQLYVRDDSAMSRFAPCIDLSPDCMDFLCQGLAENSFRKALDKTLIRLRNKVFSVDQKVFYWGFSVDGTMGVSLQVDENCACIGGRRDDASDLVSLEPHNIDTAQQAFFILVVFAKIFEEYDRLGK